MKTDAIEPTGDDEGFIIVESETSVVYIDQPNKRIFGRCKAGHFQERARQRARGY